MGCWYGTCGLSQVHIRSGEEVLVVPIVEDRDESYCYSSAMWVPAPLSFWSHYNDYGAGENSTGRGLPILLDAIKKNLVEFEQGENEYHDIPVKVDTFNEEVFWDAIHEGRLQVKDSVYSGGAHRKAHMVMIKKSILDYVLDNYQFETYYRAPSGEYKRIGFTGRRILDDIPAFIDYIFEDAAKEEDGGRFKRFMGLEFLGTEFNGERSAKDSAFNLAAFMIRRRPSESFSPLDWCFVAAFEDIIAAKDHVGAVELMTDHMLVNIVNLFMQRTRKAWCPQIGSGSQSDDHAGYQVLNAAIAQVLDAEREEWDEEDEDEDEDEDEVDNV